MKKQLLIHKSLLTICLLFDLTACTHRRVTGQGGKNRPLDELVAISATEESSVVLKTVPENPSLFGPRTTYEKHPMVTAYCESDYLMLQPQNPTVPKPRGVRNMSLVLFFYDVNHVLIEQKVVVTGMDGGVDLYPLFPTSRKSRFISAFPTGKPTFSLVEVIRDRAIPVSCGSWTL